MLQVSIDRVDAVKKATMTEASTWTRLRASTSHGGCQAPPVIQATKQKLRKLQAV